MSSPDNAPITPRPHRPLTAAQHPLGGAPGQTVDAVIWRSQRNPIIPHNLIPTSNSIFNSAVVPFEGAFAGVFRCDDNRRQMQIHAGRSDDGVNWRITPERIHFAPDNPTAAEINAFDYAYDPRVCWIEDRYYVTWCNGYHGPTIGVGYTLDFETFYQMENAFLPFNRNGVLFPRRINGKYAMLSRPSDNGHTPFGDIYYSESPDMVHWGRHRSRDGDARRLAIDQDRRGADAHRDERGLAAHLSRRADLLQRLCLQFRRRAARPRPAVEGHRPRPALLCWRRRRPTNAPAMCPTLPSRAPHLSMPTPGGSLSITAAPTPSPVWLLRMLMI
jgi:hypothetical protein